MYIRYQAQQAHDLLKPVSCQEAPLQVHQIRVAITHCGVCHSDVDFLANHYGDSQFPLTPGHEIIGKVIEIGSKVKQFTLGQRVGIAWQQGACGQCHVCQSQHEELCPELEAICLTHPGGFAEQIVVNAQYVYPIPEIIDSAHAAPLLCAGGTVYNAIIANDIKPGMRTAVIGIGGLGHLALQFLKAFGCHVTAFSSSPEKADDAKQFGADDFASSIDKDAILAYKNQFDFVLSTVGASLDYNAFVQTLKPFGKLCFAGIPIDKIKLDILPLIIGQRSISGIPLAGRKVMQAMLTFAATHDIRPHIELMPVESVHTALKQVSSGNVRYRIVLSV